MKKLLQLLAGFGILTASIAGAQTAGYVFSTIAGVADGNTGSNDGTNGARFFWPYGIAVDNASNVYVADTFNDTIRKISPAGTNWMVVTIAGTALAAEFQEGTNNAAFFNDPSDITVDSAGNLYVADTGNHIIRKLIRSDTNWVSSTLAGTVGISGRGDGTNLAAQFFYPSGIAVDGQSNVFIADTDNNSIREITPVGTNWITRTIAGSTNGDSGSANGLNNNATFFGPTGITLDAGGDLYVADTGNSIIRKITHTGTNWNVGTIAGNGTAGSKDGTNLVAQFSNPAGISMDGAGNLYVADTGNNTIRKITPAGTNWIITTIGGIAGNPGYANGAGTNALFDFPSDVAADNAGNLYVADTLNDVIRAGKTTAPATPPNLSIKLFAPNNVVVSWPATGSFTLQTNRNLATTNWGNYGGATGFLNGTNSMTNSPPTGNMFFRLR